MDQTLTRSEVRWNEKTIGILIVLALIPNLLGTINLATPGGSRFTFSRRRSSWPLCFSAAGPA